MNQGNAGVADFEQGCHLLAQGELHAALTVFDQLLAADDQDWQSRANRALIHYRLGAFDKALDDYCLALAIKPDAVNLLVNFAVLLKELGQLDTAESLLVQALQLDPAHADAWSNLGIVRVYRLQYDQGAQCHVRAIELAGDSPARWTNLGNALTGGLYLNEAVEAYGNALQLAPDYHEARYNQSIPLFMLGRYREAWPLYESRWQTILTPRFTERRWQGEPLGQDCLLIWSEQGLGDCLQMARFLPLLRATHPEARLVLACPASLHRLFASLSGIELIEATDSVPFDWQLPMASLPGIFQTEIDQLPVLPYLAADPQRVAQWAERLPARQPGKRRVGLVWQSGVWGVGAQDLTRQYKSIEPGLLQRLLPLADFVSLWPGALPDSWQGHVHAPAIQDFADTAALIAQLDLVLCVDTAVAHLAGAMGHPVWLLMRQEGAPFFGVTGEQAPWYPSIRVLRQPVAGDWLPVLAQVQRQLQDMQG
ncbi:tetratricopeptide repeat protein [Paludibacterium sp. B53371]|uniref:tetratricopeptide repeat-containing glycosyltransferase family protein n=1 Tax=Paludibacterium sp. B53371 TaxID=2806263 RepID=UPI001C03B2FB|nr:tetratricopeptide repeat-containing glycosyltransferase family protein [Paludibacterium sp. B53371]